MKKVVFALVLMGLALPLAVLFTRSVQTAETELSETPATLLFVRTTPSGAKIFVDGKEVGTSDDLFNVEPGIRRIMVELADHAPDEKEVVVRSGEITQVKLSLIRRSKSGPHTTDAVPELIAWGKTVNGLQLGLGFHLGDRPYRLGEVVSFKLYARNLGSRNKELVDFGLRLRPTVRNSAGGPLLVAGVFRGGVQRRQLVLPGKVHEFVGTLHLKLDESPEERGDRPPHVHLRPGTYRVSQTCRFVDSPTATWSGELTTGELELRVIPSLPGDHLNSTPQHPGFGPVVERVVQSWNVTRENIFLDLDSGALSNCPKDMTLSGKGTEWPIFAETSPIDVGAGPTRNRPVGLFNLGIVTAEIANQRWETITVDEVRDLLGERQPFASGPISQGKQPPLTYAFKTRQGSLGILQIVGLTDDPKGVKIHYKLAQPVKPDRAAGQTAMQQATFGPMIERELKVSLAVKAVSTYIDLDLGRELEAPKDVNLAHEREVRAWARRSGADAQATVNGLRRGIRFVAAFSEEVPAGETQAAWNTITADSLRRWEMQRLASSVGVSEEECYQSYTVSPDNLPLTVRFQTREGGLGVLQIVGFTGELNNGVKIRYRMVQRAQSAKGAAKPTMRPMTVGSPTTRSTKKTDEQPGVPADALRLRLSTPAGTEYRQRSPLPLELELQNVGDKPVPFGQLGWYAEPAVSDETGQRLVVRTPIAMGPWVTRAGTLSPGAVIKWTERFNRLRFAKPLRPGQTVQQRFELQARGEGPPGPRGIAPSVKFLSNPVTLKIIDPHPSQLAKESDVPSQWGPSLDMVYLEDMGLAGRRLMHIDGEGRGRLVRPPGGAEDPLIPWGQYAVRLAHTHLDKLARLLHEQRIWELARLPEEKVPPGPDEGGISLSFASAEVSLVRKFPRHVVQKQPALLALQDEMHRLMPIVVAQDMREREGWGGAHFSGLQIGLNIPTGESETVRTLTPDRFTARLGVKNTGEQAIKLAVQNNESGRRNIADEWLIGLYIDVQTPAKESHRFRRADDLNGYWYRLGNSPTAKTIQPGGTWSFPIRLHKLVDKEGTNLFDLRGRYQLRPVLNGFDNKLGLWRGTVAGPYVPVEIGGTKAQ